jgi:hypothetical protein
VNASANVLREIDGRIALYATTERSRLSLAEGLKKAGVLGGNFVAREDWGTKRVVLPSMALTKEESITKANCTYIDAIFIIVERNITFHNPR